MDEMIQLTINLIAIIILSIIAHEFGHYIIAKFYKLNPKIKINFVGIAVMHERTDSKKLCYIGSTGIIFGLIVLTYMSILTNIGIIIMALMVYGYVAGCYRDIKELKKNIKTANRDEIHGIYFTRLF